MNLNEMLQSDGYIAWYNDRMNNLTLHNPERHKRCEVASKDGADGSFHYEIMNDWQEYIDDLGIPFDISNKDYHEINIEIIACWDWHDKNGSLIDEVG